MDKNVGLDKQVTISGLTLGGTSAGNYVLADSGNQETTTATIESLNIEDATVELNLPADPVYDGSVKTVSVKSVKMTVGTILTDLVENTDYTVDVDGLTGTEKGSYTVTLTGKNNFSGETTATWAITSAPVTIDTLPTAGDITYGQTLRSFLSSAEFKGKNHGNEELVRILYKAYLYRDADPNGLAKWKLQLDVGQGLDSVIKGFEGSAEFKAILNGLK